MSDSTIDLREIPTRVLEEELARRGYCLDMALCPYCLRPDATHTCKFVGQITAVYGVSTSIKKEMDK